MQVVILAAGRGDRFVKAGFIVPKPMILARGNPMVYYAMQQASAITPNPVLLCPDSLRYDVWRAAPADVVPTVVGIHYVQQGAAMTLLAAASALDEQQPVLIMDCDSVLAPSLVKNFSDWSVQAFDNGRQSTVLCFNPTDSSARYSFVRLAQMPDLVFPEVVEVVEKVRISNVATCGVHAFSSWSVLRQAICSMVEHDDTAKGEFYVAPLHNYVSNTACMTVEAGEFTAIGTPEQLEAYEVSAAI